MATLLTQVTQTQVNYANVFVYIMNVSFNGIQGDIQSAKIKVVFPSDIQFTLGDVHEPIKGVSQNPVAGGTQVTFDFGTIVDLGVSARLSVGCQFKISATSGESFACQPELWINDSLYLTSTVSSVTLHVVPQFQIQSYVVLPLVPPAPGGDIYYAMELDNFGDAGAAISDVVITYTPPEGVTLDPTYAVIGKDISAAPFQDTSSDGVEGVIANNTLTFTIPAYRGTAYKLIYKVHVSSDIIVGTEINNIITWMANGVQQSNNTNSTTLALPSYDAVINKYGPDYTLPGEPINYQLYISSEGNQQLTNVAIVDELPPEIDFYEFQTGTFKIPAINQSINGNYNISYTTINGVTGTLGPFNTNVNQVVNVRNLLAAGDGLADLTWNLVVLGIGVTQDIPPQINGIVKSDIQRGTTILNHFQLKWTTPTGIQQVINNNTTIVDDLCSLVPLFREISPNTPVNPGETIRYRVGADCVRSRLQNPIIALLLPATITYVGNVTSSYSAYFTNAVAPVTPAPRVIPNFKNTGLTLVKFTYDGASSFNFTQRSKLAIEFDVRVPIGAKGTITQAMLLNNTLGTGVVAPGVEIYRDRNDIAENGNNNKVYAQSGSVTNPILFFASTASNKKVKGALDTLFIEEPFVGKTTEGGFIEYLLAIQNTGNADLTSVEIVDILPHIGDTGVIEVGTQRLSEFVVYNMNSVSATITPLAPGQPQPVLTLAYSTSYDPVRFGNAFQIIGTANNWTSTMPPVATELRSFKVSTQNTVLHPAQTLQVRVQGVAPVGVLPDKVAWNSFAAKVSYIDLSGRTQYLLAVEPEKVGIAIQPTPVGTGVIGGMVWLDTNGNGIYESGEQGVDDVGVILYDETGRPLRTIFTAPNVNGNPGYYLFTNLPLGNYYVRFAIQEPEYEFTTQRADLVNGSKPYKTTGVTPLINLNLNASQNDIIAGIMVTPTPDRIKTALEVNNSAQKMLRNVIYNQMLLGMKLEDAKRLLE